MDVNAIIRDQGPRDPTLLHLQETHRSRAIWRASGAPLQTFRRRDANQSDMNMDVRLIPIIQAAGVYGLARGVSLQALAEGTRHLPNMHQIATQSLQAIRDRHAYVFHQLLVEEHEAVHDEEGEDAGDRGGRAGGERGRGGGRRGHGAARGGRDAARGGRPRGRGGRARGRGGRGSGRLVDEPVDDADNADE
ncbi:hypothetical protein ACET3Z_017838 [Daucus carota]